MNFDFTDDQQAIKATARDFLADRFSAGARSRSGRGGRYDERPWTEMVELGWPGIFIEEDHGGQGLGMVELAILMEEMGYSLAPSPFFSNAAAGLLVRHAGSEEQRSRHLPGIASGEGLGTAGMVANGAALAPDGGTAAVYALVDGDGRGVLQELANGMALRESIDSTRTLYTVPLEEGEELPGDVTAGLDRIRVALAAELVGVGQRAMEMAVAYASERQQFGRPIGAYQAISHRCAQMLLEVEGARAATLYAAWAADHEPESLPLAASMAKAYASDAGTRVTASALQVHGGIGFTWEHDLHLFLKRANGDAHMFGDAREHRDRVSDLAGIAAVPTA